MVGNKGWGYEIQILNGSTCFTYHKVSGYRYTYQECVMSEFMFMELGMNYEHPLTARFAFDAFITKAEQELW